MADTLGDSGNIDKEIEKSRDRGSRQSRYRNILILLSVVGPGIITSNVDNDAGGITTYSVAGAHFGLSFLWVIIPVAVALFVIQEMTSRMGVVNGKGLAALIREQFGVKITFYLMVGLILTNLGNAASEFAGIAASLEIFGVNKNISVPLCAILVWLLVVKGTYRSVEKVFLVACIFYFAYIIAGFLAEPSWKEVGSQLVQPTIPLTSGALAMVIGLVGTTIAPWMQFYQQAAIVEKGVSLEHYRYARWDVAIGTVVVNVVAFFIIVVCASTLFRHGIRIETAQEAALALEPLAGRYCSWLFGFGLFNASLFAASILPLSTAYTVCEGMGWESGINQKFFKAPQFYGLYTLIILVGAGIILLPGAPLIAIMLISQVINGILLPFVIICMLLLANNSQIMGQYKNSKLFNVIAWTTAVVMICLSLFLAISVLI